MALIKIEKYLQNNDHEQHVDMPFQTPNATLLDWLAQIDVVLAMNLLKQTKQIKKHSKKNKKFSKFQTVNTTTQRQMSARQTRSHFSSGHRRSTSGCGRHCLFNRQFRVSNTKKKKFKI